MGVCHNIIPTVAREIEGMVSEIGSAVLQALQKATGHATGAATRGGEAPRLPETRRQQLLVTALLLISALPMGLVLKSDGLLLVSTHTHTLTSVELASCSCLLHTLLCTSCTGHAACTS